MAAQLSSVAVATQVFVLLQLAAANHYSRADFPADFIFGSGISASQVGPLFLFPVCLYGLHFHRYFFFILLFIFKIFIILYFWNVCGKYEGAAFEDGRTRSIWDTFAHSGRTKGANGDVACDGYHKYNEDIRLMVETGLEALRMSISWSRLIPNGRGPVNPKGLQYYNNLINALLSNGIQPHVVLSHIDLPQALEDEYQGWLSRKIVKDFVEYADVCFKEFGDRVLHWTTLNEVNIAALGGYDEGTAAPGRCSIRSVCAEGDSTTEPYTVVHNMLLAHSSAAKLYRDKYKPTQNGKLGLNIYVLGLAPYTNSTQDVAAAQRARDFYMGWVMDPLFFGDYPGIVKKRAGSRIPTFTKDESEQIKGSVDFIGLNHYVTYFVKDGLSLKRDIKDFYADLAIQPIFERGDTPADEYPIMPWGLKEVLEYLKQTYGNPPIYIQENGQKTRRNGTLNDASRVEFMQAYIGSVLDAVRNGSNTKGYFQWTFLDCLELLDGYRISFGLYYVDLDDKELKRYRKLSGLWYSNFLKGKNSTKENNAISLQVSELQQDLQS